MSAPRDGKRGERIAAAAGAPRPRPVGAPAAGEREGHVLPFRRRRFQVRHRRPSTLGVLLRGLAGALAVVGPPAAVLIWATTSPTFALRSLEIAAAPRVPQPWVRSRLADLEGENLLWLPLAEVRSRLERHPWLRTADIRKRLPASLSVRVEQRQAAAVLESAGGELWIDAAGEVIAPVDALGVGRTLLRIAADGAAEARAAMALAAELARRRPDRLGGLERVEVIAGEDFVLGFAGMEFPLVVSGAGAGERMERFLGWRPAIERRYGALASADLRFAGRWIVRTGER